MRKTLYIKFLMAYLIFGLFGFMAVASVISGMTFEHVRSEKATLLYKEAMYIASNCASDLYNSKTSLDSVQTQLEALSIYLDSNIWIINPSGRVVLDSERPINIESPLVVEGFNPTAVSGSYYMEGSFFDYFSERMLSVYAPIVSAYKVNGYVVIHTPVSHLKQTSEGFLNISYMLFLIMFLLSMIILFFFSQTVYTPLRRITHATEQYASGNMHYEFQVESDDEMGYLAATLGYMAKEIAGSEDNQKKFVANVSHDFRSPLTSIRGYLQAMMDGTIPPESYSRYLEIVINETERLTKLTNELLQLNNLNTKGVMLNRTDFDINDMIRHVSASFEGVCRQKNLSFELILSGSSLFVNADADKIQQVLYNLIDNAIKFSHNDGVISIETSEKRSRAHISVKDHGIGIPKDSLKLIWERFYKTDISRGKDKKGTGLGLAIVKEIIHTHDENINVISTEGVGTEFIFTLPKLDTDED